MTHVEFCLLDRAFDIAPTAEVLDDPPISVSAERVRVCGNALAEKRADLIDQPAGKVTFSAFVDARIEFSARRIQRDYPDS